MDANQLTAYRDAATAAKHLAIKCGTHTVLSLGISKIVCEDIPTLATAVDELVAEVERLNDIIKDGQEFTSAFTRDA